MTRKIDTRVALSDEVLEAVSGGGIKNAVSFGLAGAQAGILGGGLFGPVGSAVGAVVAGAAGAIGGALSKDDPKGRIHVMY
jgi:hypothetical protein